MTRQPAISFSISFLSPFNRAGGRTSNVLQENTMNTIRYIFSIFIALFFPVLSTFAQDTLKLEDLVRHLNVQSWIYDGNLLPKHCLVDILEVRKGKVAGVYLGSVNFDEVKRMVILLDNNNPDEKVRVTIKVEGGSSMAGCSLPWKGTKKSMFQRL